MRKICSKNISVEKNFQEMTTKIDKLENYLTYNVGYFQNKDLVRTHCNENDLEVVANKIDDYYTTEMNHPFGIAGAVAVFECFTAGILWKFIQGAATFTNWMTSLAELAQVGIANTKVLGDPRNKDDEKAEIAKLRRESAMAWTQISAGFAGLFSYVLDFIKKGDEEIHAMSFFKKLTLSVASAVCAISMFFGFGEKTLIATVANGHSKESKNIRMNGDSDGRCAVEWTGMSIFTWFSQIKPVKAVIDFVVPYFALREGLEHLIANVVNVVIDERKHNFHDLFGKTTKNILEKIFFISSEHHDQIQGKTYWPFNTEWFLGTSQQDGFRTRVIVPILRFFGCRQYLPLINLMGDIDKKGVIVRIKKLGESVSEKTQELAKPGITITTSDQSSRKQSTVRAQA